MHAFGFAPDSRAASRFGNASPHAPRLPMLSASRRETPSQSRLGKGEGTESNAGTRGGREARQVDHCPPVRNLDQDNPTGVHPVSEAYLNGTSVAFSGRVAFLSRTSTFPLFLGTRLANSFCLPSNSRA